MNYTERTNKIIDLLVTKNDEQETILKGNVIQIANLELVIRSLVQDVLRAGALIDPLVVEILPDYAEIIKRDMERQIVGNC